ncbi:ribbon-helix-helix protein, CopG family [Haloactinomyces albus]|uniref:Uncharacterized protein (DUF1778 family) n=1 Tax=Haloactinomyces albus TaxID=1352928 RepID=A0AAE3Z9S1_9ACTN|nr:ribbon-helix-helix protein, CopG family [Haloactinomyces albus]MDR7300948.1 uncharacterized protein (DUF1778 family) [Haloactinomyces albus]
MTERNEPEFANMTDAELAEWQYAHKDELDAEWEQGDYEPVEVELAPTFEVTRSFRLPVADARLIDEAAERAGTSRSEWIRRTLLAAARPSTETAISQADLRRVADLLRSAEALVEPAVGERRAS